VAGTRMSDRLIPCVTLRQSGKYGNCLMAVLRGRFVFNKFGRGLLDAYAQDFNHSSPYQDALPNHGRAAHAHAQFAKTDAVTAAGSQNEGKCQTIEFAGSLALSDGDHIMSSPLRASAVGLVSMGENRAWREI